jgi:hypothetical protein
MKMANCLVYVALVTTPIRKAAKSFPVFCAKGRKAPPEKVYWPEGSDVALSL